MARDSSLNRRRFLATTAAVGGGIALAGSLPVAVDAQAIPATGITVLNAPNIEFPISAQPWLAPIAGIEINPWIVISPDNAALIRVNQTELGQGTFTSNPMMVAEELECDWSAVRAVYMDINRHFRENKLYGWFVTGATSSVRLGREIYQKAGANARERLRAAAAQQWGVPVVEVTAKNSILTHGPTGRTLSYGAVAARAASITLAVEPPLKTPNQYALIGKRLPKMLDVELKVYGLATFGIDVRVPNMVYATIRQSPTYNGKLRSYDFNAIKNRRGVIAAVPVNIAQFADDIMRSNSSDAPDDPKLDASGIAVVADSWWRAKQALDLMPIEWDAGPDATLSSVGLFAQFGEKLQQTGIEADHRGDAAAALSTATKVVEATYTAPYQAHAPMEPQNCTVQISADRVDVWAPTQCPDWAAEAAAKVAGVSLDKVYVHPTFIGGSYGRRYNQDVIAQAVAISKALNGRPVKLLWTREEDIRRSNTFHPGESFLARAAIGADGMPAGMLVRKAGDTYAGKIATGPRQLKLRKTIQGLESIPYAIPNLLVEAHEMKSVIPTAWLRGTSSIYSIFFLESFIDECAHAAGKDPYQYRRALLETASPEAFDSDTKQQWIAVLDLAAKNANWGSTLPKGSGRGIAIDDRHYVRSRKYGNVPMAAVATVSLKPGGAISVDRIDMVVDRGRAMIDPLAVDRNLRGQIAWAMSLGMRHEITFSNGRTVQNNFNDYPILRMAEFPKQIGIEYIQSDHWILGIGDGAAPLFMPAICNAIFAASGKRVRSLPVKTVTA